MKKLLKATGYVAILVAFVVIGALLYLKFMLPQTSPAAEITFEKTPEKIERGRYLANAVTVCVDCHSTRDWSKFSGPIIPGSIGAGGEIFNREMGFPGIFYSRNITPYGIGDWTDGEVLRAVVDGINKNGEALFPVMDYHNFGKMDREDIYSILAYIRTLESKPSTIPSREIDFPVNFLINTMPHKAEYSTRPPVTDEIAYGKYLVTSAGCITCHSQKDKGATIPGTEYGGGMQFIQPGGIVTAPNITFDAATGLNLTREDFIARFKMYEDTSFVLPDVPKGELVTPMPWTNYAQMTPEDLGAIYAHLKSIKPISNQIERFKTN